MFNETAYQLGIAPSGIRQLFAYGMEQAAKIGAENVYDYSIGNPSIPAPKAVEEAIKDILATVDSIKIHGYSKDAGIESVRAAIAENLTKRYGMEIKASNLFMTCGAAPGLIAVIKALLRNKDSEVIVIAPYFPEYKPFIEANGGKFVLVPADVGEFQINMPAMEKLINKNTVGVIVNSPNNPSGVVYTEETLKELGEMLDNKGKEYGHPIYIISDEPYRELIYGDAKVSFIPNIYRNTVVCYSYSKSLSLPGERIGYICVPDCVDYGKELYAAISGASRISGHVCAPTLMQMVIERCVNEKPDLKAYDDNRKLLYTELTKMGYTCAMPDGAFYLFIKAPGGDAIAFSEKAKFEQNLLLVPGDPFGCPGYLRASYCVSNAMIRRSLPAFQRMIDQYK
jgi:aspartate aminotransferase